MGELICFREGEGFSSQQIPRSILAHLLTRRSELSRVFCRVISQLTLPSSQLVQRVRRFSVPSIQLINTSIRLHNVNGLFLALSDQVTHVNLYFSDSFARRALWQEGWGESFADRLMIVPYRFTDYGYLLVVL